MKKFSASSVVLLVVFVLMGCSTTKLTWVSKPAVREVGNKFFDARLRPTGIKSDNAEVYKAFIFSLKNKTDKELKIIWDETFYVHDGGMSGGFMFEGIPYEDRNKPKSPTVLAANGSLTMKIWPSDLAFYHQFEKAAVGFDEGTWIHNELKPGQNGMLLTVKVGERVINEKITVDISVQEVK